MDRGRGGRNEIADRPQEKIRRFYLKRWVMARSMKGKTALVTGAGMGIGRAIALAFANEGANVVVADIDVDAGNETASLVGKSSKGLFMICDVSKEADVKAVVEATIKEFGGLDYACNNAGIHPQELATPIHQTDEAFWYRIMDVNLKSIFLCMKHELRFMVKQKAGVIVNTASLAGLLCEPGFPLYTVAKHGVIGLTKAAAFEYVKKGIRVNAVCPSPVDTPMLQTAPKEVLDMLMGMLPMGRVATAEEVAGAVMYLCSDIASYQTGVCLPIDGGASLV
jgi:NAD(P)-dependent dehydrogenase (short-subunit alcohol dehydrogenase family)